MNEWMGYWMWSHLNKKNQWKKNFLMNEWVTECDLILIKKQWMRQAFIEWILIGVLINLIVWSADFDYFWLFTVRLIWLHEI